MDEAEFTIHLAEIRERLAGVVTYIDQIADQEITDEQRETILGAAWVIRNYRPRSLHDVNAWFHAVKAGEEAWILIRSVPGEFRGEAWLHPVLKPNIRKALTGE